mmetsp:Transcript_4081/g.9537  ORF Transcript_4081/g.9537 Transcript_4081/m.9537 type:complete len:634 (-) Transcript_4081:124-2025(-)
MEGNGTAQCRYFQDGDHPPFRFFRQLPNGSRAEVGPEPQSSGLCGFLEADCKQGKFACCELEPATASTAGWAEGINQTACVVALALAFKLRRCINAKPDESEKEDDEEADGEAGTEESTEEASTEESEERRCSPKRCKGIAVAVALALVLGAEIYMMTLIAPITQRLLPVPARNSMIAADAFLVPTAEIFQFLEDVVTVKINSAMGAGDIQLVRPTLIMGVVGGAVCGIVAASLAMAICSWPAALQWLLAPYTLHDSYLGCPLVPEAAAAAELARAYLLLQVWSWPANFVCRAVRGFLLGAGPKFFAGFLALGMVNSFMMIGGIYVFFISSPTLETLGWIYFVSAYTSLLFLLGMFLFARDVREQYNLRCVKAEGAGAEFSVRALWKDSSREGFFAMLLDVSAQMSVTVGIYTAGARLGMGAMYQISALQAMFALYGYGWFYGVTYVLRLTGTQMVAKGDYQGFRNLFRFIMLYAFLLIIAVCSVLPYKNSVSFLQAKNACEYASDSSCLTIYNSIFGGGSSRVDALQDTFLWVFIPVMMGRCFYQLFKGGLYACLDWSFMAKVGVTAFICIFIPSILLASWLSQPSAIFVAMYLPWLAMTVAFMVRIRRNIKKMLSGRPGPWFRGPEVTPSE